MTRSITRWTTTVATAAVLGLPVVGFANTLQDPAPQQQPQPTQQEPAQPASPTAAPTQSEQTVSPQEHLKQAKAAVDSITTESVPTKSRAKLADLKRHLSELEKKSSTAASTAPEPAGAKDNWGKEVAAIDKIITEMTGDQTTGAVSPGASTPGATGTSGTSKAEDTVAVDEATRAKLMEVRTHITAYAAGMAGSSAPKTDAAAAPSNSPAATPPSSAAAEPTSPAQSSAPPAAEPTSPAQSPAPPAAEPTPTPAPAAQQPGAATQEPGAPAAAAPGAEAQPGIDADAARRHLMAARESLSQITQLPAAQQLTGEARTQVAQLISNFNELITTQSNWRASYEKVDANLTALIGSEKGDAEAAAGAAATTQAPGAPAPGADPTAQAPTRTPGSVGTAGSTTAEIDPAIRGKLVELRQHLAQFEKASGGAK